MSNASPSPVPLLLVGGYLGAGKTTLINEFLGDPGGKRVAVLVNDFGSINVDADLIARHEGSTFALTNGCVCCTIGDDMITLVEEVASSEPRLDAIIVEASGVAQLDRLAILLLGAAGVAQAKKLTVVNVSSYRQNANDKFVGQLYRSQTKNADCHYLNRLDEFSVVPGDLMKLLGDSDAISTISDALTEQRNQNTPNFQTDVMLGLEDFFDHSIFHFHEPIPIDELSAWLKEILTVSERVKGQLWIVDHDGSERSVLVNLSKGDEEIEFTPSLPGRSSGSLVVIYRSGVDVLSFR